MYARHYNLGYLINILGLSDRDKVYIQHGAVHGDIETA